MGKGLKRATDAIRGSSSDAPSSKKRAGFSGWRKLIKRSADITTGATPLFDDLEAMRDEPFAAATSAVGQIVGEYAGVQGDYVSTKDLIYQLSFIHEEIRSIRRPTPEHAKMVCVVAEMLKSDERSLRMYSREIIERISPGLLTYARKWYPTIDSFVDIRNAVDISEFCSLGCVDTAFWSNITSLCCIQRNNARKCCCVANCTV